MAKGYVGYFRGYLNLPNDYISLHSNYVAYLEATTCCPRGYVGYLKPIKKKISQHIRDYTCYLRPS
jgi:hypothetical protein